MLRITVTKHAGGTTLDVEGRLAGPWVEELGACWRGLEAAPDAGPIRIELGCVTFVDAAGKALLRTLFERGARLAGSECMTKAIVREITAGARR